MSSPSSFDPPLDKPRHLRYWQRCARTLLPHHYTPNDSQRLTLGFFIIAALDLLSSSPSSDDKNDLKTNKPLLTPSDRRSLRAWVLSCQHPNGGFCGSPTHVFPHDAASHDTTETGNANIAATYFALLLLPMLSEPQQAEGGAYVGVDRAKTLRWLRRLQRVDGDGSFGEVVYEVPSFGGGEQERDTGKKENKMKYIVGGGKDMRYCYLAAAIRWILRGDVGPEEESYVEDINVAALVQHIRRSQSYDGGFSESLGHESHAGYAYCAVAALALLDRPINNDISTSPEAEKQETSSSPHYTQSKILQDGIGDIPRFISFLASRQFTYLEKKAEEEDDDDEDPETANFQMVGLSLSDNAQEDTKHIGFNGRCNKVADTCYTWWVLGSLSILGVLGDQQQQHAPSPAGSPPSPSPATAVVDPEALGAARTFLLEKTQHAIGGFGKRASDPPDIYHSSLGLFALATMGDPALKSVDAALAVSVDTVRKIEAGRRGLLRRARAGNGGADAGGAGAGFGKAMVDMAVFMGGGGGGERPAWLDVVV